MSEWIDVSLFVEEGMITYNDKFPFKRPIKNSIDGGDLYNESRLDMGCHTGTHIDAPYHFNNDGKRVHQLDLDTLVGECFVVELMGIDVVTYDDLARSNIPDGVKRLLIKTDNSVIGYEGKFRPEFVGLDLSAVRFIHEKGILLLGTDYFAISKHELSAPVHQEFFKNNECIALEAVNMKELSRGWYDMICLPLRLKDADGSPARVIVKKSEH